MEKSIVIPSTSDNEFEESHLHALKKPSWMGLVPFKRNGSSAEERANARWLDFGLDLYSFRLAMVWEKPLFQDAFSAQIKVTFSLSLFSEQEGTEWNCGAKGIKEKLSFMNIKFIKFGWKKNKMLRLLFWHLFFKPLCLMTVPVKRWHINPVITNELKSEDKALANLCTHKFI